MENVMDRLWNGFGDWRGGNGEIERWSIPVDVKQKGEDIEVKASLPGVKPEEIDVSVEDGVLTIKAETTTETETEETGYLLRERSYGSFYRALRLPDTVDAGKIKSSYENGVLHITMPKAEEKKRKQIKVSVAGGTAQIEGTGKARK
jgi:HSP20 family protein